MKGGGGCALTGCLLIWGVCSGLLEPAQFSVSVGKQPVLTHRSDAETQLRDKPNQECIKESSGKPHRDIRGGVWAGWGGGRSRTLAILPDSLHVVGGMNKHLVFTHLFTLSIGSS